MIRLTKRTKPQVLVNNEVAWTTAYMVHINAGTAAPDSLTKRYREPEIKSEIKLETSDKCAYCESKVTHIDFGDVEHIKPKCKTKYPQLIFTWDNLTLACSICNNNKDDYDSPTAPIVHPYNDDPSAHLEPIGPFVFSRLGDPKGTATEGVLKLNRKELFFERKERIENLNPLLETWHRETDPSLKQLWKNQLLAEANADKEYSFVVLNYLRARGVL